MALAQNKPIANRNMGHRRMIRQHPVIQHPDDIQDAQCRRDVPLAGMVCGLNDNAAQIGDLIAHLRPRLAARLNRHKLITSNIGRVFLHASIATKPVPITITNQVPGWSGRIIFSKLTPPSISKSPTPRPAFSARFSARMASRFCSYVGCVELRYVIPPPLSPAVAPRTCSRSKTARCFPR